MIARECPEQDHAWRRHAAPRDNNRMPVPPRRLKDLIEGTVDHHASQRCGPCRVFGPVFERASARHADAVFGKVDTEAQPGLAGGFGISSIPTLMVIRDGIILYAQPGALPEPALEQLIARARGLDMDEVRSSIAERSGSAPSAGA